MKETDAALDARLRATFAPPADMQRIARDVLTRSGVTRKDSHGGLWLAAAAILLVALTWARGGPVDTIDLDELHAGIVEQLGPPLACTSLGESNRLLTQCAGALEYHGDGRVPLQGPFNWPADWSTDRDSTVWAGHDGDRVVVVVIASASSAREGRFEASGDLQVHRRELDAFVLYEVSTGDAPVCLDRFYSQDYPE